jgi:TRAP-type uncharacterized transport system fused permease subunit
VQLSQQREAELISIAIVVVAFMFVAFLIFGAVHEQAEVEDSYNDMIVEKHCKVIGKMPGQMLSRDYVSSRTGYLCDDGMTYWLRDR